MRAGIALVVALAIAGAVAVARHDSSSDFEPDARRASASRPTVVVDADDRHRPPPTPTTSTATTTTTVPHNPADDFVAHAASPRSTARISPKSVDATGTGLVFAQNMMYRHTMTVYDATTARS